MTFWLIRAGKRGEFEQQFLDNNIISFGWNELPDLSNVKTKDELKKIYQDIYSTDVKARMANQVGQIWSFSNRIEVGDLIALPLKSQRLIALGEATGNYQFVQDDKAKRHQRTVKWIKTIPRSHFDQDILYSLGAYLTIGKVKAEDAENRVRKMLGKNESDSTNIQEEDAENRVRKMLGKNESDSTNIQEEDADVSTDYEQIMLDQITKHIKINFKGHKLTDLVNEILVAKGFVTKVSPPGPDGGVDILAGSGPLGLESPRICVQVKSSESPSDVRIVREIEGVVNRYKADYGLLVAWGGITSKAEQEIKTSYFSTRLWREDEIVKETMKHYEKFSDELKIEMPLKRTWILVENIE